MRINEYLEIVWEGESRKIRCSCCGHVYGSASENVKTLARMKTFPITKAGPLMNPWEEQKDFELREFYCPQCASMFSVELNRKTEPILWDISIADEVA
jgi:acetone carboxylase gamma subunit